MKRVGMVDTTFARYDMAKDAIDEIKKTTTGIKIIRRTVPGIKDLAAECKILMDEENCDVCMAFGMPGPEEKDKASAQVASQGLMIAQLLTNKHILEIFVHEDESTDKRELAKLCENRSREHAQNLVKMLLHPEKLTKKAGTGQREGFKDKGPLRI